MKSNRNMRRRMILGLMILFLAAVPFPAAAAKKTVQGIGAKKRTQAQIRSYLSKNMPSRDQEVVYSAKPSVSKPYKAGALSKGTLKSAVKLVNCLRYIAGMGGVSLNKSYSELAQAGALVSAANLSLSHSPVKPSGMKKALYKKGYDGCRYSNLGYGYSSLNDAVFGWLDDNVGQSNVTTAGHRRWMLDPALKQVGFGAAQTKETTFYAMHIGQAAGKETKVRSVAWPAVNTPASLFSGYGVWSLSVNHLIPDQEGVKASLLRLSDGKLWQFSATGACDGNLGVGAAYGMGGAVVFQPEDLYKDAICDGDRFLVTVTGLPESIQYTVTFFALSKNITKLEWETAEKTLKVGEVITVPDLLITPYEAFCRPVYRSSDTSVAEVNQLGQIIGADEGTAVITASCGGKKASLRVTVEGIAEELSEDFRSDAEIRSANAKRKKKNQAIVDKQLKGK